MKRSRSLLLILSLRTRNASCLVVVVAGWVLGLVLAVVAMTRTSRFLHLVVSLVAIPANILVAQVESLV